MTGRFTFECFSCRGRQTVANRRDPKYRQPTSACRTPDEPDTVVPLVDAGNIDNSTTDQEFSEAEAQMLARSRWLLKPEWIRTKLP